VAETVKIYQIAKALGIPSKDLVEICRKAGFPEITHHSNAVSREKADEIRKTAIKKYRPKEEPTKRVQRRTRGRSMAVAPQKEVEKEEKKKEEEKGEKAKEKPQKRKKKEPLVKDLKGLAPPPPIGKGAKERAVEEEPAELDIEVESRKAAPPRKVSRKGKPPASPKEEGIKKRTIVFKQLAKPPAKKKEGKVEVVPPVTVRELSEKLGVSASQILKDLMFKYNVRANINQVLDNAVVELMGVEYGVEIVFKQPKTAEERLLESLPEDRPEDLKPRPPVVALLGHVDHGKTTILDRIRHTNVAGMEDGGITQDIGAWQITHEGHKLTFVDTPGHKAFTAMRARGAQVTDIVVLVVAADDGVMPQTEEAISHARAANVPIVVAINKVDKPDADPMAVKRQLAAAGLNPEEWGGETGCVEVSGLTGYGIDELLERITLEAELLELKANPDRNAQCVVLDAKMVEGLGVVANVIVQNGTLRKGDAMFCGPAYGRVRSMFNPEGEEVTEAGPSCPVAVSGLNRVPEAGMKLLVLDELETARQIAEERLSQAREGRIQPRRHVTMENLHEWLSEGKARQVKTILKGDVQGTLEPLVQSLEAAGTAEVSVNILHQGIGDISESDVLLADASDAIILGFRVGVDERARELAEERGVQIRTYRVIYEVVQDMRDALEGLLEPERKEERVGLAEVRRLFKISRFGTVAGCFVVEGSIRRDCKARVLRNGETVYEGAIASLRRQKDDVREVERGFECGINLEGFDAFQEGDLIECFKIVQVKRTLS